MDAQRDLTIARLDQTAAISESNIAQFALLRAIGKIPNQDAVQKKKSP